MDKLRKPQTEAEKARAAEFARKHPAAAERFQIFNQMIADGLIGTRSQDELLRDAMYEALEETLRNIRRSVFIIESVLNKDIY